MVWKNREREERRKKKAALSKLPFDVSEKEEELKKDIINPAQTLESESPSSDPEQLSEFFRSKGNQLAEVCFSSALFDYL